MNNIKTMDITTKYDVGDVVWIMDSDKPRHAEIEAVNFVANSQMQSVTYNIRGVSKRRSEEDVFASKEKLLKAL